ncbi:ATP-binding cassette domain-containing protein, partial [Idiomarina sp.]
MSQINLKVQSLNKHYGARAALTNVSLNAYAGEVIAVLGKNGAGKTTLINSILGMHNYEAQYLEILGTQLNSQHRP